MNGNDHIPRFDSAPAGEFSLPQDTDAINIEFNNIIKGEFPSLSEIATSFALSSPQLNPEAQLSSISHSETLGPQPEAASQQTLQEYHLVSHSIAKMRAEAIMQRMDRKAGFLPEPLTRALGVLGLVGSKAQFIEEELVQAEAELSQQLFADKEVTPPANEIWEFVHLEGDWYWNRTRKGEDRPYLVTHFFVNNEGTEILMVETSHDKSAPRESLRDVVDDVETFMKHYALRYMELIERHLYAAPMAKHSQSKKH